MASAIRGGSNPGGMHHEASEFLSASAYVSQCVIIVFCEMLITEIVCLCAVVC